MRLISPSTPMFRIICGEKPLPHKRRMISFVYFHVLGGEGPWGRAYFHRPGECHDATLCWSMEISKSLSLLGWPPPTVVTLILGERCFPRLQQHQGLTGKEKDRGQESCRVMHHIHYGIHLETYCHLVSQGQRGMLGRRGVSTGRFGN